MCLKLVAVVCKVVHGTQEGAKQFGHNHYHINGVYPQEKVQYQSVISEGQWQHCCYYNGRQQTCEVFKDYIIKQDVIPFGTCTLAEFPDQWNYTTIAEQVYNVYNDGKGQYDEAPIEPIHGVGIHSPPLKQTDNSVIHINSVCLLVYDDVYNILLTKVYKLQKSL
jgi:hypothetical protein